ncbi:MAG: DoxX family protein [Elusimicrobia bacterium CG11_big_fil_rev_8_21_14_0_20_64_6]|nr:MAG: DoxX family protein [Elusimicrobia bacterium CG11_big_fil_rev_8_21_14_0_20_64_6]
MKFLGKFSDVAYAALRFMSGWMFAFHGAQKLFGVLSAGPGPALGSQIWIGGVIELVGGLMIALGIKTRWAAFLCSGTMAVAYTQFHWKLKMNSLFFPAVNKGELAVVYCFVFLLIACQGGGKFSFGKD